MPGPIMQVIHRGDCLGQLVINRAWWRPVDSAPLPLLQSQIEDLATELGARYLARVVSSLNNTYTYRATVVQEVEDYAITPLPGSETEFKLDLFPSRFASSTVGAGTAGGVAGESLPLTVSGVCHFDTGRVGRRRRGRWKMGPFSEGSSDGNTMTAAFHAAFLAQLLNYIDPVLTAAPIIQYDMVVFSPTTVIEGGGAVDLRGATSYVNGITLASIWGVQQSRKLNTGPS